MIHRPSLEPSSLFMLSLFTVQLIRNFFFIRRCTYISLYRTLDVQNYLNSQISKPKITNPMDLKINVHFQLLVMLVDHSISMIANKIFVDSNDIEKLSNCTTKLIKRTTFFKNQSSTNIFFKNISYFQVILKKYKIK